MTVAVVVDSSSGVTAELGARWGVSVVPLAVTLDGRTFEDREGAIPEGFYSQLQAADEPIRTAAPNPSAWMDAYQDALADGHDHVVVLAVSSAISSAASHAQVAARLGDADRVTVIDTGHAGGGHALIAGVAARAAAAGAGPLQVAEAARRAAPRAHLYIALSSLEQLVRSGRIPRPTGPPPSMSSGPPMITIRDGAISPFRVDLEGGTAEDRLVGALDRVRAIEHVLVVYADESARAMALADRVATRWPTARVDAVPLSAVVGGHCGPGALGVAALASEGLSADAISADQLRETVRDE